MSEATGEFPCIRSRSTRLYLAAFIANQRSLKASAKRLLDTTSSDAGLVEESLTSELPALSIIWSSQLTLVLLVVRWYLSYKLSLRDLPEMFQERGFEFSHESVRSWILRFTPVLVAELRKKRHGKAGISWYVDETYIKVKGKWTYLYRAIDRDGGLVDTMLSKTRDVSAARRFFASAIRVNGGKPKRVTTDKHPPYPRAISTTVGKRIKHRTNQYLNNRTEQSHRPLKQRYYPMLGFGAFSSAAIICRGIDELRNFFRPRIGNALSLSQKRRIRASKNYSLAKMALKF